MDNDYRYIAALQNLVNFNIYDEMHYIIYWSKKVPYVLESSDDEEKYILSGIAINVWINSKHLKYNI